MAKTFRACSSPAPMQPSRILHLQYLSQGKRQSTLRCQSLITPGSDHPPVLGHTGSSMKTTAKAWRNHRSKLKKHFVKKGLTPFEKHPHIEPADWEAFVRVAESEEAEKESARFKALREQYRNEHSMGPAGYEGMESMWEEEDSKLLALGIPNPYEIFPEGRPRNWLRARSKLQISELEGVAHIRWKTEATKRLSEEICEKQAHADSSSCISWVRDKDVLTQILGPEQPGRVRGFSSYAGWKYGWPEHSGMCRKRRKQASSADLRAIKEELRVELQQDLLSLLASQGLQIVPVSRNTSPAPGQRSSCASASKVAARDINEGPLNNGDGDEEAPENDSPIRNEDPELMELMELDQSWSHDTISCLSDPHHVYPKQFLLHSVQVDVECAVVKVDKIGDYPNVELPIPPNDEISKIGEALLQRIQWSRRDIVVLPRHGSSQTMEKNSTKQRKSLSDAAKSGQEKQSAPKNSATKSAPISVGTVAAKCGQEKERMADATIYAPINAATKSGQEKEKMAYAAICVPITAATKSGSGKERMVETSKKAPGEGSNKQQAIKSSKEAAGKKQSKKKGAASAWTRANPRFNYGQPILIADELNSAGSATISLHNYYLKGCAEKKKDILVQFRRAHLLRSLDKECFLVGFNDLYDLFNVDALDVSLLRCFTLSMISETKARTVPVGFLDPELMSLSTITSDRSYVVNYVAKAMKKYVKKKLIMFAHNTIGHWVSVVVIPKWKKVLYFDSLRRQARDHKQLKEVLNEAFISYCSLKKVARESLQHVTKFQCHQQPSGNACGFYVVYHLMKAMELLSKDTDLEEFEVMTTPLSVDVLHGIRENIASFIVNQVISDKGEFHCSNPGLA
ncbi:unnamed protein product [Urochloa decumbens]|uniref:Ubiquitin-like protease family profile domain-containing protein n=1 Tax=Urochloa decumbens TaxID=240449 RepID=A0ABC8XEC5_9POAL